MTCPDCNGSGKYVGLNSVEDCKTCGKPFGIALEDSKANPDGTHTVRVAVHNNQLHALLSRKDVLWSNVDWGITVLDYEETEPPSDLQQREIAQQLTAEDNAKQKFADMTTEQHESLIWPVQFISADEAVRQFNLNPDLGVITFSMPYTADDKLGLLPPDLTTVDWPEHPEPTPIERLKVQWRHQL